MAFYNRRIVKNKYLMKAWRAAHNMDISGHEEISLPAICGAIEDRVRRHRRPRSRLALRSFAALLAGAVRLYRDQVNQLLSDTFNYAWIQNPPLPERNQISTPPETVATEMKNESESEKSSVGSSERDESSTSSEDEDMSEDCDFTGETNSTVFTVLSEDEEISTSQHQSITERREQAVQTEPPEEERNGCGFDPNAPFGCILVHDSYRSRIPKKIILCSLNAKVKFLK